jgi:hypothetical protein
MQCRVRRAFDARGVARFDVGCALRPSSQMRGHRDEAYLAVYRIKADDKGARGWPRLRRSAAYQKERRAALGAAAQPASAAASSPLEHQCQALWAETQRARIATR